ncbi:malto-oligosyltrehalose synthase [Actinobaculum sp. 352]|uniref:malto-oligosyltrehalose synthase n=1 Tax=Actinobaculum sp. 352 TaxID=2490946 RepID=UPI000F7F48FF|nr:malto-oligosyltrehalose synthase [Actinobaculum sp. 352]RTE48711.1 malto-oligosyltrehalose synthase [Actinobaculum sp. 352]
MSDVDSRRSTARHTHVPAPDRRQPVSTYRLQLGPQFTCDQAVAILPYLKTLGITDVYCSPILQAAPGSTHGYDVVDHTKVSHAIGGREAFQRLADAAHASGMGVVVDIVPNHMAVPTPLYLNRALWSVLRDGADSPYANWFDIDLDEAADGLMMPVLGDRIGTVLAKGQITVETMVVPGFEDLGEQPVVRYFEHVFPVRAQTESLPLADLLERQYYRLAYWRVAEEELNYRRFFDVDTLAAIRTEDADVFNSSHALLLELFDTGYIDAFRIDHPDGLSDPREYLARLYEATGGAWVVAEKITEGDEELPADWRCCGTTGYDAAWRIGSLLTDPVGVNRLTALYVELSEATDSYPTLEAGAKAQILSTSLHAEMERLTSVLAQICHADVRLRDHTGRSIHDALGALIISMDRYRAYVVPREKPSASAENAIREAADRATKFLSPDRCESLEVVVDILLGREVGSAGRTYEEARAEAIIRFQQVCGAVMAKGVEDTAFYRYTALTSATEVGGDPMRASLTPDDVVAWTGRTGAQWPSTMTCLTTHDTKRGEDTRAAISVLSEWAQEWRSLLTDLRARHAAARPAELDGQIENLMWQTITGTWTDRGPIELDRLLNYLRKAAREQKSWTNWTSPDEAAESALFGYARSVLGDPESLSDLTAWHERTARSRRAVTLAQKTIALTLLGVADSYQGEEVIQNSLVDPDNRRPVDFDRIATMLTALDNRGSLPGDASLDQEKLWITSRILRLRRERPLSFVSTRSGFAPLPVTTSHAVAFTRTFDGVPSVVTVAQRLPRALADSGGFGRHTVVLPEGHWQDVLTGHEFSGGPIEISSLLEYLPVAVLARDSKELPNA